MLHIHKGMSLREAIRIAQALGVEVSIPHGTGEIRFRFHVLKKSVRVNARRPDVSRKLVGYLRLVAAITAAPSSAPRSGPAGAAA